MNPYDFVPIDRNARVERKPAKPHHCFDGKSGRIEGTITTLTPLFIRDSKQNTNAPTLSFIKNKQWKEIIPATSLKGMIRSLVEVIAPGCFLLFDGRYYEHTWQTAVDYSQELPNKFKRCRHPDRLCPACRMFGVLVEKNKSAIGKAFSRGGHVNFDDAVITHLVKHSPVCTPNLLKPRAYHEIWYLQKDQEYIAGRKFYFHQHPDKMYIKRQMQNYGHRLRPVGPNSQFTFSVQFNNLDQDELNLLLYALVLEPSIRHKIGYAKPAGLGSVKIELTRLELIDYKQRYTSPNRGKTVYTDNALNHYVDRQIARYTTLWHSITLQDLRRIWMWPPVHDYYGYPTRDWFNDNPDASIHDTINAPRQ